MTLHTYSFIWLTPLVPSAEIQTLGAWVHSNLQKVQAPSSQKSNSPKLSSLNFPAQAILIEWELNFSSLAQSEQFRQNVWEEILIKQKLPIAESPFAISLVSQAVRKHPKSLTVFDFDATLIEEESINEIAELAGVGTKVADITERAMVGELNFLEAFKERCRLLKGFSFAYVEQVQRTLNLTTGAEDVTQVLKAERIKTAVVSGGFNFILNEYKRTLGLDYSFGNDLEVAQDQTLTGNIVEPVIDGDGKKQKVSELKAQNNFPTASVVVVGDGANDVLMMQEAGTQISFCGKEKLNLVCNTLILHRDLRWILPLIKP